MKVVLDAGALGDLERIRKWIERDNPDASRRVIVRLFDTFDLLAAFPNMGHAGLDEGTREWTVPGLPYVIVYEINAELDELIITAVSTGRERGGGGIARRVL